MTHAQVTQEVPWLVGMTVFGSLSECSKGRVTIVQQTQPTVMDYGAVWQHSGRGFSTNSQIRLRLLSQWTAFGRPGPPGVAAVAPVEEVQENGIVLVHLRLLKEDPVVEGLKTKKSVELKSAKVQPQYHES